MFFFLLLGGISGAATLTTAAALASAFPPLDFLNEAWWILVIVPLGALIGISVVRLILSRTAPITTKEQFVAWVISTFMGFPASFVASFLLVGAGPDYIAYRYLAFVIEYGLLWGFIVLMCLRQSARR